MRLRAMLGRNAIGARWFESVAGDVSFAVRHLRRRPLTTLTIVLVSSIGIGVHAAVFSLIQAVTMRPAPGVPRDDALVAIRGKERFEGEPRWRSRPFSYPEFLQIAASGQFASVAGWTRHVVAFAGGAADGGMAQAQFVTSGYFSTIGIRPILGAGLPAADDRLSDDASLVAVISHALWTTTFASSTDVIGTTIRLNDVAVRIVGVAPPRFNGAVAAAGNSTIWLPLSARAAIRHASVEALSSPDSALFETVARLRDGVRPAQADAAVRAIDARFAGRSSPRDSALRGADVVPLRGDLSVSPTRENAIASAVGEAIALLILLITCTNVSALVVGAGIARRHEVAIRLSLGASRRRVVRQLLTESSLLALAGGAFGLLVYWWISTVLAARLPKVDITPDIGTVAYTMAVAAATGILFGLSPALEATRRDVANTLKGAVGGAPVRSRLQRMLVVAQIALTQPLLVGLGVLIVITTRDGRRLQRGGIADRVITVALIPPHGDRVFARDADALRRSAAFREQTVRADAAMRRVAALPGVVRVTRSSLGFEQMDLAVAADDHGSASSSAIGVRMVDVGPDFFSFMEMPIVLGRALVADDSVATEPPIIIGSDLARDLWPNESPIGKRLERANGRTSRTRYAIVGVYDSRRAGSVGAEPFVYVPMTKTDFNAYLVRTARPAAVTLSSVHAILRADMPDVAIGALYTLAERDDANRAAALQTSGLAGGGGVIALILASIGLYGVVALAFSQRRREIGIRTALGARSGQVVRMLFGSGLRLSVAGLLLGLPLSVMAAYFAALEVRLPEVTVVGVGLAIAALVIGVASLATWIPARRAATVDPTIALRAE